MRQYQNLETQRLHDRLKGKAKGMEKHETLDKHEQDVAEAGDVEHLHAIHGEHAKGAKKSAHIYQHEDGVHHLHTHDHQTGEHAHTEHSSHEEALAAAQEHLAGSPEHEDLEDKAAKSLEAAGHGEERELAGMHE